MVEVRDEEDGSATVVIEASDEFKSRFCEVHGLVKFSEEKFQQWFLEVIDAHVNSLKLVQP